ncbi:PAPP5 [Symbiodinium natans]|uniref:protein-serine/threonine phosphatase n=1 Tax=Symbiodinium natans TaxID=878477 RepID=A0A812Q677_9DINO|nr:PAPP5 [Symbiodinium natans]
MALRLLAVALAAGIGHVRALRSAASVDDMHRVAAMYVESMEETAIAKTNLYEDVPGMDYSIMKPFLEGVAHDVLTTELHEHGFARMVTASHHAVIIGDLHGQLFNLLAYLKQLKADFPDYNTLPESKLFICDPKMQYVFMGDYVDRGERSIEIVLLLFAYKVLCPSGLIMLQGNHEAERTNQRYGFMKEVRWKLGHGSIYHRFNQLFQLLPFVAVAPEKFMATHGGLSRDFVHACEGMAGDFRRCLSYDIGSRMVWSDPHMGHGWAQSKRGGSIENYGLDVAKSFLQSNGLKRLLRGHEQVERGHVEMKLGDDYGVHTIFSSADYVGVLCVDSRNQPYRKPPWDTAMFRGGGTRNMGAIMIYDLVQSSFHVTLQDADTARRTALDFAHADCSLKYPSTTTRDSTTLASTTEEITTTEEQELTWKERFMTFFGLSESLLESGEPQDVPTIPIECEAHLTPEEARAHEQFVRSILAEAEDMGFEARKIIDLEGEAEVCEDPKAVEIDNCKSMTRDMITLKVFRELTGNREAGETPLEDDIVAREDELEPVAHPQ